MAISSIQDRTQEFRSILAQAQKRAPKTAAARQSLLSNSQKAAAGSWPAQANGNAGQQAPTARQRSEFARQAARIGRAIAATTAKLERLAQLAGRKTLFDDRPVEINELTFVIKQDLAALNGQIGQLQGLARGGTGGGGPRPAAGPAGEEGEHNKNVVVLLQGKLADVSVSFKEVLELRTRNIQASRSRTENFVSHVGSSAAAAAAAGVPPDRPRTDSPLYQTPSQSRGRSPRPGSRQDGGPGGPGGGAAQQDLLTLDMEGGGGSGGVGGPHSNAQLLLMEEAQQGGSNTYVQQRGEAIETIERTINELGGIFGQLAQMVSEQSEMIQRIDANTEDVVDNVQGAQRELMKYWSRVSGNRWLVAKMFGVLMIFFLLWVLIAG
ncbi:t-SNARE [Lineolata rhizophorae]|uniref:t-SNARE n=1 Tax=Lineolata rhizophorae TaxID=578093 RepID=A0A6A6NNP9_9PEZI|nr:t-SNARE [Lineolata rhizophorae]